MINLYERMLPTSAGVNSQPPGLQSDGASNWATKASDSVDTDNPLYNDTPYDNKICYNDNLIVTQPSLKR